MDIQVKGGHHDSVELLTFRNRSNCELFFEKVKTVFLNINCWGELFGEGTEFQVCDINGNEKYGIPKIGDLIKIKIPGPKSTIGEGDDWVEIVEIINVENLKFHKYGYVFSPCSKPGTKPIAHFFESEAKNYFFIKKFANEISAEVHGRNEVPNYDNLSLVDIARNFLVAYKGILGFSKAHWESWVKNILDKKYVDKCLDEINLKE